jgi:hypothetical protein
MRRYVLPLAVAGAVVAAAVRPGLPAREPPSPAAADSTAAAEREDQFRKTRLLGGDRWRRVAFEFDAWLREQPVYTPAEAARIRADLDRRVAGMSSYEVEYLLDTLEAKLRILDRPAARDAREWLGRYLAVMSERKRAEVLDAVPDVLDMTTAELVTALDRLEAKRAAVEDARRASIRGREAFADFVRGQRAADEASRAARGRIRVGDAAFSPYRPRPVADPPFADAAAGPPALSVGPWGTFIGLDL